MEKPSKNRIWMRVLSLVLALFLVITLVPVQEVEAASITISKTSATVKIGSTLKLKVYADGTEVTANGWGTSDPSVATVNSNGLVTGKLAGSCVITAFVQGNTVECLLSVVKNTAATTTRYNVLILDTSNSVKGTPLKREKTAAKRFCRTVLDADGTNYVAVISMNSDSKKTCSFTSNYSTLSSKIDSITASGNTNMNSALKLAKKLLDGKPGSGRNVMKNIVICSDGLPTVGSTLSSGRYDSGDHSKYYKFANATYKTDVACKGEGYFVYALGFFHNSTGKNLSFGKKLMKDLASKDKYFVITKPEHIDSALNNIADAITATTINKKTATIYTGKTLKLTTYVSGVETNASWSSSNTSVATVSSTGLVTAKNAGTATITGVCNGKTLKCVVTVKKNISITLNKTSLKLNEKFTYKLKATVTGTTNTPTWKSSNTSIATVSSKGTVTGKSSGTCKITATVSGKKATCTVKVISPVKYTQTGVVKNATSGAVIKNASVYVYIGSNKKSGTKYASTKSDSEGKYKLKLPKGSYTIVAKKDGYITSYQNYKVTGTDKSYTHVLTLSKKISTSTYRIVLTWGSEPRDLDSHLFGPIDSTNRFHVYFGHKNEYNYNKGKDVCLLDLDDTSSYGPETITLNLSAKYTSSGTYRYYVYDYTNKYQNPSSMLGNSGAKVTVYNGNRQVASYNVPKKAGTIWHVFDIVNGTVKTKNVMSYTNTEEDY